MSDEAPREPNGTESEPDLPVGAGATAAVVLDAVLFAAAPEAEAAAALEGSSTATSPTKPAAATAVAVAFARSTFC